MNDQVPTAEAKLDPAADENCALQAARDTRVQFALEASELARRLLAIATNDEHSKQLDAIKLALGYSLGAPTLRVEARVQTHTIPPEVWPNLVEALREAKEMLEDRELPKLISGDATVPTPEQIAEFDRELGVGVEKRPSSVDPAPPEPPPAEPEPYRPRFDPDAPLRRDVPGVPIRR